MLSMLSVSVFSPHPQVNAVSGEAQRNVFFDRMDVYCKDLDLKKPIQIDVVCSGLLGSEHLGSCWLGIEKFRQRERYDGAVLELFDKHGGTGKYGHLKLHATRVRYEYEPYEKSS